LSGVPLPESEVNKEHWNSLGARYSGVWQTRSRRRFSSRELSFISGCCPRLAGGYLDIGCGNGRILTLHDSLAPSSARLTGLDIAESMLDVCRGLSFSHPVQFFRADIALDGLPAQTKGPFVFITAIRVLKYNQQWKDASRMLAASLAPGGVFIMNMPNKRSLNVFGHCAVTFYRTTQGELRALAKECGLEIIGLRGFSRIPDVFYTFNGRFWDWLLAAGEATLNCIFGKRVLQRELFIALKRPESLS
jgi:SAM-dependent methyltransferase